MKSKAKQLIDEIATVPFIKDVQKAIKFEDLPEPIRKELGFISKNVTSVHSSMGTYDLDTNLGDLSASLIGNLSKLGKHLASITPVGNRLIVHVKKDWKAY